MIADLIRAFVEAVLIRELAKRMPRDHTITRVYLAGFDASCGYCPLITEWSKP